jgi:hypothetical protein
MSRLLLFIAFIFFVSLIRAQNNVILFKKKNKTLASFAKGSYIAFQLKSHLWFTGNISRIQNDTFYIKPMMVRFQLLGADTSYQNTLQFTLADVYAMPKKGVQIDYINGRYQITSEGGHIHWYWIKSGWVFRVGAAGYAGLNIVNGLIKKDFSFSGSRLGIAAAVFAFGELLHFHYKFVHKLGKKYYLATL